MVSTDPTTENTIVYDEKLSSVVPASITGEDKVHDLKNMDLVMKLHYIRGVYFFNKDAAEGLEIGDLKKPMFLWLQLYHPVAGRVRRADEGGRPFIKCNDSGIRILEAKCSKTLDEWLASGDSSINNDQLVHSHVLGPDLAFAPLVFVQFTWFKCGGLSVGVSWSHILGDAFSASDFINIWGQILADDQVSLKHLALPCTRNDKSPSSFAKIPFSSKRVDPIGDHWLTKSNCKMKMHSLHLTAKQLNLLLSKASEGSTQLSTKVIKPFELVSAIMWKSLAKIRGESEPKVVTICRNDSSCDRTDTTLSNSQVISTVEAADLKVAEADLLELGNLIAQKQEDERSLIEEQMESDKGKSDYIIYGAHLTFVDWEETKIYDLELNGRRPIFANYSLSGVGDEGAVLVLPGKEGGRIVNLILPETQVADLKDELRKEWSIF